MKKRLWKLVHFLRGCETGYDLRGPEPEPAGKFPTKSQVTVYYDVPCSNEAMDSINQSFEKHMLSDATSLVPRYEV